MVSSFIINKNVRLKTGLDGSLDLLFARDAGGRPIRRNPQRKGEAALWMGAHRQPISKLERTVSGESGAAWGTADHRTLLQIGPAGGAWNRKRPIGRENAVTTLIQLGLGIRERDWP